MKKVLAVILGGLLLIPTVTWAADTDTNSNTSSNSSTNTNSSANTNSSTSKPANNKPVNDWTCEDFLALESTFRPTAVGYAEALNNKDKPEDAVIDVQGIETVTPAVIEACTQDKESSFKDKVKNEWDKLKKKV